MPTSRAGAVEIEGLREFQRALREAEGALPRELRLAHLDAAAVVAIPARARAESLGGVAKHIAPSIRATAEQRSASVSIGGAKYPMAMGANFGAKHDVERSTSRGPMLGWNQFPEVTKPDRILWRTIAETREPFIEAYGHAVDRLMHRAFPEGSSVAAPAPKAR